MGEQVFEAGQVVEWDSGYGAVVRKVVAKVAADTCEFVDGEEVFRPWLSMFGRIIRPAPKPGMRWMDGDGGDVQIIDADGVIAVEDLHSGAVLARGVVPAARCLLDNGYELVKKAESSLSADSRSRLTDAAFGSARTDVRPIAAAVCAYCGGPAEGNHTIHLDDSCEGPEVHLCDEHGSRPTPTCEEIWARIAMRRAAAAGPQLHHLAALADAVAAALTATPPMEQARRWIDAEIARVLRPHQAFFDAALRALAEAGHEHSPPSLALILSTAAALDAAEGKLPVRGAVASWHERAAMTAAVDTYQAVRGTWEEWWIGGASVDLYLDARAR